MKTILKVVVGIGLIGQGLYAAGWTGAPNAPFLITDSQNHRVIEVGTDETVLGTWSYTDLKSPMEATPLTSGRWLIADSGNRRIIEVDAANKVIKKEWWGYKDGEAQVSFTNPQDVRRCVWYDGNVGTDTLLVVDGNKFVEILYHEYPTSTAKAVYPSDFFIYEAEKRPGKGTPTYLIAAQNGVYEISTSSTGWQQKPLYSGFAWDAEWLPCGSILVVKDYDNQVVEVKGYNNVVSTWTLENLFPREATMMEDGNILIAASSYSPPWGYILRGTRTTEGGTWTLTIEDNKIYGTESARFVDVEEKGIINIAKITYFKQGDFPNEIRTTLAGVVVPILQPMIIAPPFIVATKTVTPTGPLGPNAIATYTITLTNTGAGIATDVAVIDQIPAGTEFEDDSDNPWASSFSEDGGVKWIPGRPTGKPTHLRWEFTEIGPGMQEVIQFSVKIKE